MLSRRTVRIDFIVIRAERQQAILERFRERFREKHVDVIRWENCEQLLEGMEWFSPWELHGEERVALEEVHDVSNEGRVVIRVEIVPG